MGVSLVAADWGADAAAAGGPDTPPPPRPELEALEAAVSVVLAGDPGLWDGRSLADEVARLETVMARLAARQVACVAVLDARGHAQGWGFRSTQAWLRAAVRIAPGAAKGLLGLARRLHGKQATPGREATAAAFAAGRIGVPHAQLVTRTMSEIGAVFPDPEQAAWMEADLVAVAERTDPLRLAGACRRLRIAAAPDRAVGDDWDAFARRELSIAQTFGGLVAIHGVLDPMGGETVAAALHALSAPTGEPDDRSPGQRRADALTEICRRVLAAGDLPLTGGERPQVNLTVPVWVLARRCTGGPPPHGDPMVGGYPHGRPPAGDRATPGGTDGRPRDGTTGNGMPDPLPVAGGDDQRGDGQPRDGTPGNGAPDPLPVADPVAGGDDQLGDGRPAPWDDADAPADHADGPRAGGPVPPGPPGLPWDGAAAETGELAWAGPVSDELVRRILCDATVHRIVVDPASQPLDVGRATRVVPAGMRRAVALRDRHCQWPGCDVPAVWCEVHHLRHWSRGGPTAVHNLVMLCGRHHTQLHLAGMMLIRRAHGHIDLAPDPDHDYHTHHPDRGP